MAETGTLASKSVSQIFREMARTGRSGILRVTSGRQIRAVFFESGNPVFALSNVPDDQLDVLLVRQGKLTREQALHAKSQIAKETELGRKLIELRLMDAGAVEASIQEQIQLILHSLLAWTEGDYVLDTAARAPHDVTLRVPAGQILVEAARKTPQDVAMKILGGPAAILHVPEGSQPTPGAALTSAEGYLLSRFTTPASLSDVASTSGIPEDQIIPSLHALVAAGFLEQVRPSVSDASSSGAAGSDRSLDELRAELSGTLARFRASDYYVVLDLDRTADIAEIKRAYYAHAKRYHPDRYHHASDPAIRETLEAIFALVTKAYDTLKDSRLKADYDSRLGPSPQAPPRPATPPAAPKPAPPKAPPPSASRTVSHPSPAPPPPAARPATHASPIAASPPAARPTPPPHKPTAPPPPAAERTPPAAATPTPSHQPQMRPPTASAPVTPSQLAEQTFNEGMKRFESKDLLGAINLWRDAARIDPSKPKYHFQLGTALAMNPRWMKEAEQHLVEAVRLEPLNINGYLALAELYKSANLMKRAEAQYRSVLKIAPSHPVARKALTDMGATDLPPLKGKEGPESGGIFSKLFKRK